LRIHHELIFPPANTLDCPPGEFRRTAPCLVFVN
jgi:hypothetical protein